ncbi:hypothetical protein TNCV_2919511 [Trichonephila clavipes]|nr:hypothetical protein TNCV_2919511 [Trichonephila clavipes]
MAERFLSIALFTMLSVPVYPLGAWSGCPGAVEFQKENVSADENSDSKNDGDAKDQKKGDMSNELDIDFENFFCPETPCLEELANSDYIHNRNDTPYEPKVLEVPEVNYFFQSLE